jgi:hypothetical protein
LASSTPLLQCRTYYLNLGLLGLLGLHSGTEGEGQKVFDNAFTTILQETLEVEGVMESDQENITALWETICKKEISS